MLKYREHIKMKKYEWIRQKNCIRVFFLCLLFNHFYSIMMNLL